jgi:hypothetical protein
MSPIGMLVDVITCPVLACCAFMALDILLSEDVCQPGLYLHVLVVAGSAACSCVPYCRFLDNPTKSYQPGKCWRQHQGLRVLHSATSLLSQ